MRNLKIVLSYDGTDFNGWQIQPGLRTVQETLELAIEQITGKRSKANASGRTDAGVHAVGQVVNFRTESAITPASFVKALNVKLPEDVSVRSCEEVGLEFDANRDAVRKMYRYVLRDNAVRDPFLRKYYSVCYHKLNVAAMHQAGQVMVGTHDFHSFETHWPNRVSSVRTITHLSVNRAGEYIWIDVEADGFLYNMVRTIAGTLINVGRGYWDDEKIAQIVKAEDRREAGPTAPATGLFLMRVSY